MIPIPDIVINRVNTLGTGQPEMLTYKDCGHTYGTPCGQDAKLLSAEGRSFSTHRMDGEFAPLKPLIAAMPGGLHVNLPNIERRIRVEKERSRVT